MATPRLSIPSAQYVVNVAIAMLLVMAIVRLVVPDQYKSYFRV